MQIRHILRSMCGLAMLTATAVVNGASLSNADKQFLTEAAKTDMVEAHEGQMAQKQANQADVKAFAKTLVQDHTDSYGQLTELAAKTGVSIPKGINTAQDRTITQLVHLKGAKFDREFSKDEIAAHRRAIALFKREAEHGENADVKVYANKMLPILEKHLHLAEECAKAAVHG